MSSKTAQDRASLCSFLFADGRQCRMLKKNKSSEFCYFHQQHADQINDAIEAGQKIASCLSSDFVTNTSLTASLSRLYFSVARGDYDLKTARTLAYLAQIMAKTLPGAKQELSQSIGFKNLDQLVELCLAHVNPGFRLAPRQSCPPQPQSPAPDSSTTGPATRHQ
jgi:hypothetical protein